MTLSLRRGFAAAVLAGLALGSAAPAAAQSFPFDREGWPRPFFRLCLMTDSQVRNAIAAQGFTHIRMTQDNNGWREAEAVRGGWLYLLTVRSCTGEITAMRRLERA